MSTLAVLLIALLSLTAGIVCIAAIGFLSVVIFVGAVVLWVLESIFGD